MKRYFVLQECASCIEVGSLSLEGEEIEVIKPANKESRDEQLSSLA